MYVSLLFEANIKIRIKLSQEKEYQQIFGEVFFFQSEDSYLIGTHFKLK